MLTALIRKGGLLTRRKYNAKKCIDGRQQAGELKANTNLKQSKLLRLQQLLELDAVREFERRRLARELHDQMGQDLTALTLGLRSLKKEFCVTPEIVTQLEQLQRIVGQLNQQVHDIAWELRPLILDDLGLQAALLTLLEKWSSNTGIKVDFQCSGFGDQKLPESVETGLYRVIQEALTNVSKHAGACNVAVVLVRAKANLIASITDNGQGFEATSVISKGRSNKCFGLLGMQERIELFSGTFDIVSEPNKGTIVKLNIPLYSKNKG